MSSLADWLEQQFDAWSQRIYRALHRDAPPNSVRGYPSVLVAIIAAFTAVMFRCQDKILQGCRPLAVAIIRIEVTFSASRFVRLLQQEGASCTRRVVLTLWPDMFFAIGYAALLASLVLWADRWRRFDTNGLDRSVKAKSAWGGFAVMAIAAGACDLIENICLLIAFASLGGGIKPNAATSLFVFIGSLASFTKWLLLILWLWGFGRAVLRGPRREIIRLLRFSVLAVVVGSIPLLAIPQGQDLLQRLVEGRHPFVRIAAAITALAFAALAVWYCGRKVLDVIPRNTAPSDEDQSEDDYRNWDTFFASQLPRMLGLAVLVLGGAAFAREGDASVWYLVAVVATALGILLYRIWLHPDSQNSPSELTPNVWPPPPTRVFTQSGNRKRLVILIVVTLVAAFLAMDPFEFVPWYVRGPNETERQLLILRLAGALCLGVACAFYLFVYFLRYTFRFKTFVLAASGERVELPFRTAHPTLFRYLMWVSFASLLVATLFTLTPPTFARFVGSIAILSIFAANTVFLGSVAVWFGDRKHIPVVRLLLALALLAGLWNDNHQIRMLGDSAPPARPDVSAKIAELLKAPSPNAKPVFLVAASGGGLRAAYWASLALATIQDSVPTFSQHVFAMSGVSGGSLGLAFFAALTADERDVARRDTTQCPTLGTRGALATCVHNFMDDDFLSPTLAKMLAPDFAQRILPYPFKILDRATALEASWEDSYEHITLRATFDSSLITLANRSTAGVPSPLLFFNATHVETGRRYIASNVTFDSTIRDAQDVYTLLNHDMPLSVAVHNSARFTYVSPAGHLDPTTGSELGRLVDGGYFENSALVTLSELIAAIDRHPNAASVAPVVLYLCNDPLTCPRDIEQETSTAVKATSVNELLSPVRAILHARDARGSLARAQLAHSSAVEFLQLNVCDSLVRIKDSVSTDVADRTRDRVVSPPLGWNLSKIVRDWMDRSLAGSVPTDSTTCQGKNAVVMRRVYELLKE